ncbi:MAG TPA: ArgE/DapE family deacylase [Burkholderiales bacterium]|nr:ArgE/DapE family deacylase [Burkholderiales bacterium]
MREALLALLRDLVAIPSTTPPGDTTRIAAYCAQQLAALGYRTRTVEGAPGVANVVAALGSGGPSVVFNAHADTVDAGERAAWRTDPFAATVVEDRIHGLGAANCKASMAVHLWLARAIAQAGGPTRGEVVFTFVGDEENLGPAGLAHLRERGLVRPDLLVVAAPTRNRLVLEERGVMWLRATTRGKAAHAGAPHTGDSAILKMMRVIEALSRLPARRSPSGQQATVSVGRIRGGENINVVPDLCTIEIDARLLPEDDFDAVQRALREACERAGAAQVELLTGTPGFRAREGGRGSAAFLEAIRAVTGREPEPLNVVGASDARYFARDGIEMLVTGPGDGADSHVPNEFVRVDELVQAAAIHREAAARLLGVRFR